MKLFRITIAIWSLLFAFGSAAAQKPTSDAGLIQNPLYKKDCAKCHGKTAGGRMMGGPGLVSDKVAAMSADDIHNMIANGKGHMPKFAAKLSVDEIDALARQVKALNTK